MTPIHVRPARTFDAGPMARLLTGIAAEVRARTGTAHPRDPLTAEELLEWMEQATAWHLAERDGRILGVQWIEAHPDLPPTTCDIATFVAPQALGLDIGSRLFDRTRTAAKGAGFTHIYARLQVENGGALIYYQSRGFERLAPREAPAPGSPPPRELRMTCRL